MSGCVRRGECRGGAPKGERARSADEWQHSFVWRAPGPAGHGKKRTRLSALRPPSFYWGVLDGLSCSVQQTSDAIAASRERDRFAFTSPRVRGEVEERSD